MLIDPGVTPPPWGPVPLRELQRKLKDLFWPHGITVLPGSLEFYRTRPPVTARISWAEALGLVVRLEAVPYGYTLGVWSVGAICIGHYGWPRIGDVLLFVAGAVSGYLILVLLAAVLGAAAPPGVRPPPCYRP